MRVGKSVRVGPGNGQIPTACFWKFWTEGNEIYAASRGGGHLSKISVHASGQIHMHLGPRNTLTFAPPVALGDDWLHAIEIRFLLGRGSFTPPPSLMKLKKNDKALLVQVSPNNVFLLNLLVGKAGGSLPGAFINSSQIWQSSLKDHRTVLLVARIPPMDQENEKQLNFIRSELNPKANFEGKLTGQPTYLECIHAFWGPGGNVVFVVPMGREGYRFEGDDQEPDTTNSQPTQMSCPTISVPISAPNGAIVGTVLIAGATSDIALVKNASVISVLGSVTLSIDTEALRFGEQFTRPSVAISCVPTIGGAQPKTWDYLINTRFDGKKLNVKIGAISAALRNRNLPVPASILKDDEELLMRAPAAEITLSADREHPSVSAALLCSFRLRDIAG